MSYFITVEGIEGVGKSMAVAFMGTFLKQQCMPHILTREPGGTEIAEGIRQLLLNHHAEEMMPETELLLLFAGRAQHIATVIQPALSAGKWVICDRFTDASYAYQGGGRQIDRQHIQALERYVHPDLQPNRTLLLDAPVEVALNRIQKRSAVQDRIEQETYAFFERVRQVYLERSRQYPERYHIVNAAGSIDQVQAALETILKDWVKNIH